MKIIYITDNFYPPASGHAKAVSVMALNMAKKGHIVKIIAPSPKKFKNYQGKLNEIPEFKKLNDQNIEIEYMRSLPFIKGDNIIKSIFVLKKDVIRIINRYSPDIIHYNGWGPICKKSFYINSIKNFSSIATCHGVPKHVTSRIIPSTFRYPRIENIIWNMMVNFYKKIDFVIAPSEYIKEELIKHGINKNKVKVISNGIEVKIYKKISGEERNKLRNKYHLPLNKIIITYIGRIDPEKNLKLLLTISPKIEKLHKNIFFLVAGAGSYAHNFTNKAKKLENIKTIDWLDTNGVIDILGISDIFINPSPSESQSIITLEAMASSLPLIVIKEGALKNLILDDYNGYSFKMKDINTCIHHIIRLANSKKLRDKLGNNSRILAKHHDVILSIDKIEKLYYKLYKKNENI